MPIGNSLIMDSGVRISTILQISVNELFMDYTPVSLVLLRATVYCNEHITIYSLEFASPCFGLFTHSLTFTEPTSEPLLKHVQPSLMVAFPHIDVTLCCAYPGWLR